MLCPSPEQIACQKCKLFQTHKPRTSVTTGEIIRAIEQKKVETDDEDKDKETTEKEEKPYIGQKIPLEHPFAPTVYFKEGKLTKGIPEATSDNYIVVIGEAPGRAYEDSGKFSEWVTFKKLYNLWTELGILHRVVFIPVVRCYAVHENGRPKISTNQLKYCHSYATEIIRTLKPSAIFAVGFDACRALTKRGDDYNLVGRAYHWQDGQMSVVVVPLLGYAYINRDEKRYAVKNLKHWKDAIAIADKGVSEVTTDVDYVTAYSVQDIEDWFSVIGPSGTIAFDVETTSLRTKGVWDDGFYITLMAFSSPSNKKPLVVPLRYGFTMLRPHVWEMREDSLMSSLLEKAGIPFTEWGLRVDAMERKCLEVLSNPKYGKIGHNIKFDALATYRCYKTRIKGIVHDTMLASYGLNPDAKRLNGLDDLIRKYCPEVADYHNAITYYFESHPEINEEYALIPPDILFPYAALDTHKLHYLVQRMEADMVAINDSLPNRESCFVYRGGLAKTYSLADYIFYGRRQHLLLTTDMEINGVHIDKEALQECDVYYRKRLQDCSESLNGHPTVKAFILDEVKGLKGLLKERQEKVLDKKFESRLATLNKQYDKGGSTLTRRDFIEAKRREYKADNTLPGKLPSFHDSYDKLVSIHQKYTGRPTQLKAWQRLWDGDIATLPTREEFIQKKVEQFKSKYDTLPEINWKSGAHVSRLFYNYIGYEAIYKTDTGAPSTAEEALSHFVTHEKDEVATLLLEHREMAKFCDGFLSKLTNENQEENLISNVDGKIHPSFGTTDTATSRLNATKPNVQQIPSGGYVKRVYGSRYDNGWMLQRDYSGLEVRILALLSGDPSLRGAFLNGEDVHFKTQQFFFKANADKSNKPQRTVCKNALFGRVYGQGDVGLYEILTKNRVLSPNTGEPISMEECTEFNKLIDSSYPLAAAWISGAHRAARLTGYATSAFGFLRPLEVLKSQFQWERQKDIEYKAGELSARTLILGREIKGAQRRSQNTPIQSTAGDLTVFAASAVNRRYKKELPRALLCNLVHDSLWTDCYDIEDAARAVWICKDTMDNMDRVLPRMLPDYDASWIDIPIIGESEIGINAKDTFTLFREPQFDGDTFYIKVAADNPLYENLDGEVVDGEVPYRIVDFVKHSRELRLYLSIKSHDY